MQTESYPRKSIAPTASARAKGVNFTAALEAIEVIYGAPARARVEREVPEPLRGALRFGSIVVGGWYPIGWYRDLWDTFERELHVDDSAAKRIGYRTTSISITSVHRVFARFATVDILLLAVGRAFSSYFDTGTFTVRRVGHGQAIGEWRGCAGMNRLIWNKLLGSSGVFLELSGARNIETEILSGGGSLEWMTGQATWK